MNERDVTMEELTARLEAIAVHMGAGSVANKINQGGFSSAFLLH